MGLFNAFYIMFKNGRKFPCILFLNYDVVSRDFKLLNQSFVIVLVSSRRGGDEFNMPCNLPPY